MTPAIVIPTFRPHFQFNDEFLKSVQQYCPPHAIPDIFFATSTDVERNLLIEQISALEVPLKKAIRVFSLEREINAWLEVQPDRVIKVMYIVYKKLALLQHVFNLGYDALLVLDSEIVQFKEAELTAFLMAGAQDDTYRYSSVAFESAGVAKIHYQSLRTICDRCFMSHPIVTSYSWFDSLCTFHKPRFSEFVHYLAERGGNKHQNVIIDAVNQYQPRAFDWISYMMFRFFDADGNEKRDLPPLVNLDEIIETATGHPVQATAQTENLYKYFVEDIEANTQFLKAYNPPWVPFTKNENNLVALRQGTSETCCLMFHTNRLHPGAE